MSLLDTLTTIHQQHGSLTPALLVDLATDPEHPLHDRFTWDDTEAAHKWRIVQAGQLLRVVRLPDDPKRPNNLRAFVAIKGKDTPRAEYVPTEDAMADEFTRRLVLADMEREWRSLKRRYQHMSEFAALVTADILQEMTA